MSGKIIPFRHASNLPMMLREMADALDEGALAYETIVALGLTEGIPTIYIWGADLTHTEVIGQLTLAIHAAVGVPDA